MVLAPSMLKVKEMVPDMELAQRCWVAVSKEDPAAAVGIMETIRERDMAPWYEHLCQHHPGLFPMDQALLAKMKEANEAEAKRIQEVSVQNVWRGVEGDERPQNGEGERVLWLFAVEL